MKHFGKIFGMGLMLAVLIFSGCKPITSPGKGNNGGQNKPDSGNKSPFSNLTEDTAHPMRYVIDFADLVDYVKGKDENVSADGTLTVGNNEEYGTPNETDRSVKINVEGMFKGNLPKAGDIIELRGKFTSDIDIDNMQFMVIDNAKIADYWTRVVEDTKDNLLSLSKGVVSEFKYELPVFNDCLETIAFVIAYGKQNGDGACAKLKFEHCAKTDVEPMSASTEKNAEVVYATGFQGIKIRINAEPPKDAVGGELYVYEEGSLYSYPVKINKGDSIIEIPYVTAGKNYYFKIKYFDENSASVGTAYSVRAKAESGKGFEDSPTFPKIYEVDFTEYMSASLSNTYSWDDRYYFEWDVTAAYIEKYGKLPKKGDVLEYTFTGKFTTDIDEMGIYDGYSDSSGKWLAIWTNWDKPVEVNANKEITISGTAAFDIEPIEKFYLRIVYNKQYGESTFIPKGWLESGKPVPQTYEVDLTPYMSTIIFKDDGWGWCILDGITPEEVYGELPKKGDRIEYTFTGKFSADLSNLTVQGKYSNSSGAWELLWNAWEKPVEILAGEEVTISGIAFCENDSLDNVIIQFGSDDLKNGYFAPKGKPLPETYEIDFTEYLKKASFDDWGDNYGYYCDVTDAFIEEYETLPKKGDILKYSFTGTFTADIDEISVYDNYENSSGEWITTWANWNRSVKIEANKEITISGTAVIDMEIPDVFNFKMLYPHEYGDCQFTPKGYKEGDTYAVDLTEYMSTIIFRDDGWGWCIIDGITAEEFYGGLPKEGDKIEYTVTGKFSADLDKISVQGKYSNSSGAWELLWNDGGKSVEIQANEEVTISGIAFCENDSLNNVIIQFGSADLKNGYFVPKGLRGQVHEVDFTSRLSEVKFEDRGNEFDAYELPFDVTDLFISLPEKGDIIKYKFSGKFSIDIIHMDLYGRSGSEIIWGDGWKTVNIKADEETTISGIVAVKEDSATDAIFNIKYYKDQNGEEYGESTFTPKGWVDPNP